MIGCSDNEEPAQPTKTQEELNRTYCYSNCGKICLYSESMGSIDDIIKVDPYDLSQVIGGLDFNSLMIVNDDVKVLRNLHIPPYPITADLTKIDFQPVATSVSPYKFTQYEIVGLSIRNSISEHPVINERYCTTEAGTLIDFGDGRFRFVVSPNDQRKERLITIHFRTTIKTIVSPDPDAPQDYANFAISFIQQAK